MIFLDKWQFKSFVTSVLFKWNSYKNLLIFMHLLLSLNKVTIHTFAYFYCIQVEEHCNTFSVFFPSPSPGVSLPSFVEQFSLEGLSPAPASC